MPPYSYHDWKELGTWGSFSCAVLLGCRVGGRDGWRGRHCIITMVLAIVVVIVIVIVSGTHVQGNSTRAPLSRYLGSRW